MMYAIERWSPATGWRELTDEGAMPHQEAARKALAMQERAGATGLRFRLVRVCGMCAESLPDIGPNGLCGFCEERRVKEWYGH